MADSISRQLTRLTYELLAFTLPGVLLISVVYLLMRYVTEPQRWLHDAVRTAGSLKLLEAVAVLGAGYLAGRLLYVVADFTVKPLVKKVLGDPDKYLVAANTAILGRFASDYPSSFKAALAVRIDEYLGISSVSAPRMKLVEAWINHQRGSPDPLQEHNHATEIMARNLAAAGLVTLVVASLLGIWQVAVGALLYCGAMTYYYYVRQVKRARGIYEYFFIASKCEGRSAVASGDAEA